LNNAWKFDKTEYKNGELNSSHTTVRIEFGFIPKLFTDLIYSGAHDLEMFDFDFCENSLKYFFHICMNKYLENYNILFIIITILVIFYFVN